MEELSRGKSNGTINRTSSRRSIAPSGRFCSSTISSSSSSSSSFAVSVPRSSDLPTRSVSPNRVSVRGGSSSSSPSVRFSIDRSISPGRSIAMSQGSGKKVGNKPFSGNKKTCMCSPTNHPGSFRCRFHRNASRSDEKAASYQNHRLSARRSAMANSLVRIGTVEGDLVKRALTALIRPSSHQQRRRCDFQPKPSRLSIMSKAEDS